MQGRSYVSVDEPQGFAKSTPPLAAATAELASVRFHGRNRDTWQIRGARRHRTDSTTSTTRPSSASGCPTYALWPRAPRPCTCCSTTTTRLRGAQRPSDGRPARPRRRRAGARRRARRARAVAARGRAPFGQSDAPVGPSPEPPPTKTGIIQAAVREDHSAGTGLGARRATGARTRDRRAAPRLLQADTTNPPATRPAPPWCCASTSPASGLEALLVGDLPDRQNLIVRLPGARPGPRLGLLGHLDVVPAEADEWSVPPFSGAVRDGYVWGRGATDMKNQVAAQAVAVGAPGARRRRRLPASCSSSPPPTRSAATTAAPAGSPRSAPSSCAATTC